MKKRNGFTLLELLVVISIIAILIGLSTVSFTTAQKKARNAKRRGDMKAVQNAFEQYNSVNGTYNATCDTMASGSLSAGLPLDPKNVAPLTYAYTCAASTYCVCANLEAETGNSDSSSCTYSGVGTKSYFCVSNLQ
ncbi:MAG TPA: type II secretion system protein [Patescibacteria group bacterium]|nr:type II secretion system protein [Patescibacteria group bacterium]